MPNQTRSNLLAEREEITAIVTPRDGESLVDAIRRTLDEHGCGLLERTPVPADPDDNPSDPKPSWNPILGYDAPDYRAWKERRLARTARNN